MQAVGIKPSHLLTADSKAILDIRLEVICNTDKKGSVMLIEIKHRFTNTVLCGFEATDKRDALQQAVKGGARLLARH